MALHFPLRKLSVARKEIFLTFDDGPDEEFTPQVLAVLKAASAPATFFLIAEKAAKNLELTQRILSEGHAIGDHSLDHDYKNYFLSRDKTKQWVQRSQSLLKDLTHRTPVGFRSPAGIWTPKLSSVLKELEIPWIHWDTRFYDSILPWKKSSVDSSLRRLTPGSIILLHDRQKPANRTQFLSTLSYFIEKAQAKGFSFRKIVDSKRDKRIK